MPQDVSSILLEVPTAGVDGSSVSSVVMEVITADLDGGQVRAFLMEVVTAPDPGASQVRGFLLEIVTAPRRGGVADPIQGTGTTMQVGIQGTAAIQGNTLQGGLFRGTSSLRR